MKKFVKKVWKPLLSFNSIAKRSENRSFFRSEHREWYIKGELSGHWLLHGLEVFMEHYQHTKFQGVSSICSRDMGYSKFSSFWLYRVKLLIFWDLGTQDDRNRGLSSPWLLYCLKVFQEDYQHTKFQGVSSIFSWDIVAHIHYKWKFPKKSQNLLSP